MNAVYHILRYLKGALRKGLIFRKHEQFDIEGYCDFDWASCADDRKSKSSITCLLGAIWSLGRVRNNQ